MLPPSNLNESQRAVIAARLANMKHGDFHGNQYQQVVSANLQIPKISQEDAAELLNVSPRLIATVKAVEREAPELVEKIGRGEMTAHEANGYAKAKSFCKFAER